MLPPVPTTAAATASSNGNAANLTQFGLFANLNANIQRIIAAKSLGSALFSATNTLSQFSSAENGSDSSMSEAAVVTEVP